MSEKPDRNPLKTKLCEIRGETSTFIDAEILENGDLQLSGQDVGKLPEEQFGDSDYEYWVTVPKEHKDRLLLVRKPEGLIDLYILNVRLNPIKRCNESAP